MELAPVDRQFIYFRQCFYTSQVVMAGFLNQQQYFIGNMHFFHIYF